MSANPFKVGVYAGHQCYHVTVEDRIAVVRGFNRGQCQAALKVVGLQKTVESAVRRRLRAFAKVATTVTFEDHGQDFLEWDLDTDGKVIECRPFQASMWCGVKVVRPRELIKGSPVDLARDEGIYRVKYPLARVQRFKVGKP